MSSRSRSTPRRRRLARRERGGDGLQRQRITWSVRLIFPTARSEAQSQRSDDDHRSVSKSQPLSLCSSAAQNYSLSSAQRRMECERGSVTLTGWSLVRFVHLLAAMGGWGPTLGQCGRAPRVANERRAVDRGPNCLRDREKARCTRECRTAPHVVDHRGGTGLASGAWLRRPCRPGYSRLLSIKLVLVVVSVALAALHGVIATRCPRRATAGRRWARLLGRHCGSSPQHSFNEHHEPWIVLVASAATGTRPLAV